MPVSVKASSEMTVIGIGQVPAYRSPFVTIEVYVCSQFEKLSIVEVRIIDIVDLLCKISELCSGIDKYWIFSRFSGIDYLY